MLIECDYQAINIFNMLLLIHMLKLIFINLFIEIHRINIISRKVR